MLQKSDLQCLIYDLLTKAIRLLILSVFLLLYIKILLFIIYKCITFLLVKLLVSYLLILIIYLIYLLYRKFYPSSILSLSLNLFDNSAKITTSRSVLSIILFLVSIIILLNCIHRLYSNKSVLVLISIYKLFTITGSNYTRLPNNTNNNSLNSELIIINSLN